MVDALGNALKFIIGPGNESDIKKAKSLINDIREGAIMGDKGYDSDDLRNTIKHQNCEPVLLVAAQPQPTHYHVVIPM